MKCPLQVMGYLAGGEGFTSRDVECDGEECAWWSLNLGSCAILIMAANLAGLVAIGDGVLNKMPHKA